VNIPAAASSSGELTALEQIIDFRGLLGLSMLMIGATDMDDILRGAVTAVPSFGGGYPLGVYFDGEWRAVGDVAVPGNAGPLAAQLRAAGPGGGLLQVPGCVWSWGYPLTALSGMLGYVVVGGDREPSAQHRFLLGVLFRNAGAAVESAQLQVRLAASTADLQVANAALERSVAEGESAMAALRHSLSIHDRLTRAASSGDGQVGIATTLHELTGHRVAIEDRHGNLMAWAGPDRPDPYPKESTASRERLLRRVQRERGILARRDRLMAVVRPDEATVGVIAVIRPPSAARDSDRAALEQACTVLALDLIRQRSVAETELRLHRDLAEDLLSGTGLDSVRVRAWGLGHDLTQPHRVVIVRGTSRRGPHDALFRAAQRAARAGGLGSLVVARPGGVAVLARADSDLQQFRRAILTDLGAGAVCRLGAGGSCIEPADFARSGREAQLALRLQEVTHSPGQVTVFDELGVYRLLSEVPDAGAVERFVRGWLGPLLDYDTAKGAQLVKTLSEYLEYGGNYDATASQMSLHRSTLRYRLKRIRAISGHDLSDPDTRFNLQLATRAWATVQAMAQH
jgi:sugar diacid utilization regulator